MARATKVSIMNLSLTGYGSDRITDVGTPNDSEVAQIMDAVWDFCLQETLALHRWKFATKRASLALLSDAPAFGYTNAFQLPSDYVRAIDPEDRTIKYTIEANKLYSDETTFNLRYVAYVSDPSKFSIGFCIALAAKLAQRTAFKITNSMTVQQAADTAFEKQLSIGKSMDAQEGGTPDEIIEEDPSEVRA